MRCRLPMAPSLRRQCVLAKLHLSKCSKTVSQKECEIRGAPAMAWEKRNLRKSYVCNGDLLRFVRERRGWTQRELATAAGYSERLVNKAESGRAISAAAMNDLAEALSTGEQPIYPEDLISDPLALAKEYIAAHYVHQKNIIPEVRHFLDENIVHRLPGDSAVIPFAGVCHGIDELDRTFQIFFSLVEAPANHDYESCYKYVAQGNEVMICGESWLHPIGAPMSEPMLLTHHLKFRRGKIYFIEVRYDTHLARQLLQEAS
jgi:transcriptional regulator with XRE-family HTH domain